MEVWKGLAAWGTRPPLPTSESLDESLDESSPPPGLLLRSFASETRVRQSILRERGRPVSERIGIGT